LLRTFPLIGKEDLEKSPQVILALEDAQVIHLGIPAVGARDKGIAIRLDLEQKNS